MADKREIRKILIHLEEQWDGGKTVGPAFTVKRGGGFIMKEKTFVTTTRAYGSRSRASALHLFGLIFLHSATGLSFFSPLLAE